MNDLPSPAFRAAREADGPGVRDLVLTVLREYGLEPGNGTAPDDLDPFPASYTGRGGAFDVLVDAGGRVVGCAGLWPTDGGAVELRRMYLAASVRGRGLGGRLLDHAVERARGLGFRRMVLETAGPFREARRLYAARGFTETGRVAGTSACDRRFEREL